MADLDRFKFEDEGYDFPFYKKNPYIPKWGWVVLFLAFLIGTLLMVSSEIHIVILCCIVFIVPVLYFLKWDYKAIFRKPSRRDILLAVALFIGYIIYANVLDALVLTPLGIVSSGTVDPQSINVMSLFNAIFSLMGEEFFKFIPFMFLLRVFYKYSKNRKISVIISVAIIMVMFASLHAYDNISFIYALCIQGFGSIFEFYGYIKTKNILISYMTHLFTDWFFYILMMLGFA